MQSVHHVVMATYKRLINPGRLQYRQFEGSFQVPPTDGYRDDIAICEAHLVVTLSGFRQERFPIGGPTLSNAERNALPRFPERGFHAEKEVAALLGERRLDPEELDSYTFERHTIQRNLYRIPIP